MKNFLKGLLVRLVGLLLIVVGAIIGFVAFVLGILFLIIASIVYLFTGLNWFPFNEYLFVYPWIPVFYGIALLIRNEWFTLKQFAADGFKIERRKKEEIDYE